MSKSQRIELLKVRDISGVLSDTFSFVKNNFQSLFSALFYVCTPVLLLYGICTFLFFTNYFNTILPAFTRQASGYYNNSDSPKDFLLLIPYILLLVAGSFLAISFVFTTSFSYIKLYKNNEEITTSVLWKLTRKYIGKVLGSLFLLILITIIVYVLCFLPIFIGTIGILLTVILFFVFLIGIFYLSIKLIFAQAFIVLEDKGIMESFKLSYQFTKGIFWKTFLLILLIGFITSLFIYLFQLPGIILIYVNLIMGIINENSSDNSFFILLGNTLTSLGSAIGCIAYSIFYIGLSILYYSTLESRTGITANAEIENIGKAEDFE